MVGGRQRWLEEGRDGRKRKRCRRVGMDKRMERGMKGGKRGGEVVVGI